MQPRTQETLLAVLFVWAAQHKATAYRQGMHELLAVLLYALQQEKEEEEGPSSSLRAALADPAWLEADAFVLFDKLMLHLEVGGWVKRNETQSNACMWTEPTNRPTYDVMDGRPACDTCMHDPSPSFFAHHSIPFHSTC